MSNTNEPLFRDCINELNEVLAKHNMQLLDFEEQRCEECGDTILNPYIGVTSINHVADLTIQNGKFKYA